MDLGISGRKAIICASSRGLGRGCAVALAEAGCDVVVNGRDQRALEQTAAHIAERFPVAVKAVLADVSTPDGQAALLEACPSPDILVNNNGGPPRRDFRELDREKILAGVVQNMVTPLELIRAVVDSMIERRFGRIINITSFSVLAPIPGLDLSSGARAGLTAFLAGVCREFADKNVTINHLLPGKMATDRMTAGWKWASERTGRPVEELAAESIAGIPAKRLGTPEEFGQTCAFLCSVHAGYITGQNILIDGGNFAKAF